MASTPNLDNPHLAARIRERNPEALTAVIDAYIEANPKTVYTEAVTVIIDKRMRIRRVGGTYDRQHGRNVDLLLDLVAEH